MRNLERGLSDGFVNIARSFVTFKQTNKQTRYAIDICYCIKFIDNTIPHHDFTLNRTDSEMPIAFPTAKLFNFLGGVGGRRKISSIYRCEKRFSILVV